MKYLTIGLHTVSLGAVGILASEHFHLEGIGSIALPFFAIVIGYLLGSWTCHLHQSTRGFWITLSIFIVLNFLHSMIDGASVGDTGTFIQNLAVLSHELGRQPALYLVLWGMLTPFITHTYQKFLVVPFAVTGIWILGAYTGFQLFEVVNRAPLLDMIADSALFLFLGDIIHHLKEEYQKLSARTHCCHEH